MEDKERIEEGQILVRTILEILGSPKEHIEKTMKEYVTNLKENQSFEIVKEHIADAEEKEDEKRGTLWSTFAELEIWFNNSESLLAFCFDSLPSSVEILEPSELVFKGPEFAGMLNDLQAKIHYLDMALKTHVADKQASGTIFVRLIQNFITYALKEKGQN